MSVYRIKSDPGTFSEGSITWVNRHCVSTTITEQPQSAGTLKGHLVQTYTENNVLQGGKQRG